MNELPESWPFHKYLLIPLFTLIAIAGSLVTIEQAGLFSE
jgi:hypothetical protein